MTKLTSFAADIRPLFTQRDIQGMSKAFNLANYDDVKAHATAIFDRIRGIGGLSYHRRRREAKVAGLNPASISSLNGWQTVINAKRSPDRNVNINGSFEASSLAAMSASLIGHSGSSTFRLSTTTAVSMSLTGSCFSSESAPRPFHYGIRERGGTIYCAALPSN